MCAGVPGDSDANVREARAIELVGNNIGGVEHVVPYLRSYAAPEGQNI